MPPSSQRATDVQLPIIPQVADWIRLNPGTISLGQGVAGYTPPAEAWAELERLRTEPLLHRYQPVSGLPELVEALRAKLSRCNGVSVDETRDLVVTAGANAAFLQVVLAICDPGDEIILILPYYFNQEMALRLANVTPVLVSADKDHFPDIELIERAITNRTRAVVTISPNNPTGAVYPGEMLRALNELCRRKGIFHVSDETYEHFTYDDTAAVSAGSFPSSSGHTITIHSFSKAYGFASWRVGYMVFPIGLREAFRKIQDTNLICPPVVSQLAALGCLRAGDEWVRGRVAEVAESRRHVLQGLRELEGIIHVTPASGAFYLLLELPRGNSLEITRRLIEEHRVAVIPGSAFGIMNKCCLRVSYGALTPETASEGTGRLIKGLRDLLSA